MLHLLIKDTLICFALISYVLRYINPVQSFHPLYSILLYSTSFVHIPVDVFFVFSDTNYDDCLFLHVHQGTLWLHI